MSVIQHIDRNICPGTPQAITELDNGTYVYRYDLQPCEYEEEEDSFSSNGDPIAGGGPIVKKPGSSFIYTLCKGKPEYKKTAKAVLRRFISLEDEVDLLNSYNRFNLGISNDASIVDEYKEYLKLVEEINTDVKKDFST